MRSAASIQTHSMPILRKLFYALILVLTLLVGATAAVGHRDPDRLVQGLASRLYRSAGEPVRQRTGVHRTARRQPVFRRRAGKCRHLARRRGPGRGQGSGPQVQRLSAHLDRSVGRRDPAESSGHLPAPRRRYLVAGQTGQAAGAGSGSRGAGLADERRCHRDHRRVDGHRWSDRDAGSQRAQTGRASRRAAVVQVRAGPLFR